MQFLSDQELVSVLTNLFLQAKSPYSDTSPLKNTTLLTWLQTDETGTQDLTTRIDIIEITVRRLRVSFIQDVLPLDAVPSMAALEAEISDFNGVMDTIALPVFLWVNQSKGKIELHWQEQILDGKGLDAAMRMVQQAAMLKNSLEKRFQTEFPFDLPAPILH